MDSLPSTVLKIGTPYTFSLNTEIGNNRSMISHLPPWYSPRLDWKNSPVRRQSFLVYAKFQVLICIFMKYTIFGSWRKGKIINIISSHQVMKFIFSENRSNITYIFSILLFALIFCMVFRGFTSYQNSQMNKVVSLYILILYWYSFLLDPFRFSSARTCTAAI